MIYSGEMVWFIGVVEDRKDPLEIGRVRVRCFGIHSDDKVVLPTEDLPWASMMLPSNSAGTGTIGQSATGLVQGAWVVGFFTDGKNMQQPLVMGVLPSIPYDPENKDKGFLDPDEINPVVTDYENDQPLSATKNFKEHIAYTKREKLKEKKVLLANDKGTWDMLDPYNGIDPTYPNNKVITSELGHVLELDDTEDNPRLAQFHNSGTNYEIHKEGERVETIVGDNFKVVVKNNNVLIKGNCNLTVDSNCTTYIKGNWDIQVDGNKTENIKGALTQTVDKQVTETYKQNQKTNITGTLDLDASTEIDADAGVINLN